ncbi:hypothetical protein TNCV_4006921 [Trichonephila clavipes]|nr:hypothetical protein TNCV_4006921 [Trichonephila clavipes]
MSCILAAKPLQARPQKKSVDSSRTDQTHNNGLTKRARLPLSLPVNTKKRLHGAVHQAPANKPAGFLFGPGLLLPPPQIAARRALGLFRRKFAFARAPMLI